MGYSNNYDFNGFKIVSFKRVEGEHGVCIRCKTELEYLDGGYCLCKKCYPSWAYHDNYNFPEKYCHWCKENASVNKRKPFCLKCWRRYEAWLKNPHSLKNNTQTQTIPFQAEAHPSTLTESSSNRIPAESNNSNQKRRYILVWLAMASLLALSLIAYLTINSPTREDSLKIKIKEYYLDVNQDPASLDEYFAPVVEKYILMENTNPTELIKQITKDTVEFKYGFVNVFDSTFQVVKGYDDRMIITFWAYFECYRKSKSQFQSCRVQEEFIFNSSDEIVSVQELQVDSLKFTFQKPATIK